jgi:hypothetical protein
MADESGELRGPTEGAEGLATVRRPGEPGTAEPGTAEPGTGEQETTERGTAKHATADGPIAGRGTADGGASAELTRLAALRRDAAAAYATISAADAALHALAGRRVAAERVLRGALARHQAASRALAAHARAKPGRLAQLLTGFRAGREWFARQADLNAALREASGPLTAARRTVSGVKREFAAQVHARAKAVTALRRLTADCVTVLEEVGLAGTGLAGTGLEGTGLAGTGLAGTGLEETRLEEIRRVAGGRANAPGPDQRF